MNSVTRRGCTASYIRLNEPCSSLVSSAKSASVCSPMEARSAMKRRMPNSMLLASLEMATKLPFG